MRPGGSLDHTATVALIAFALILGCFFASRLIAAMVRNRPKLPPLSEYRLGDCRLTDVMRGDR
jgi:hypothetical protein